MTNEPRLATWVLCVMIACGNEDSKIGQPDAVSLGRTTSAVSSSYEAHQLVLVKRVDSEIASFARSAASLMLETSLDSSLFSKLDRAPNSDVVYAADPALQVAIVFEPNFNILRVVRTDVSTDYYTDRDVGADSAREVFEACVNRLLEGAILDKEGIDPRAAELTLQVQGEGRVGEEPQKRTKEYVFFAKRRLNGASIRHGVMEAGVQVSIHRKGEIASMRIIGPSVGPSTQIASQIDQAKADELARAQYTGDIIESLGLAYVMENGGEFRPRWDYRIHRRVVIDGHEINSRAQYVSFALDGSSSPIVWPIAEPNATGDMR